MKWQPIETAPTDGTRILLRGMGGADGSLLTAHELVGRRCRIAVRHEATAVPHLARFFAHAFGGCEHDLSLFVH